MSIMMERYMKRAGISTPMGRVLEEAKYDQYKHWQQLPFLHVVDMDERGEYRAHVEDIDGEDIFDIGQNDDGDQELVADGFMKHVDDMAGLQHVLQQHHLIPHNGKVYANRSDFERAVEKYRPDDEDEATESRGMPIYGVALTESRPVTKKDIAAVQAIVSKVHIGGKKPMGNVRFDDHKKWIRVEVPLYADAKRVANELGKSGYRTGVDRVAGTNYVNVASAEH